MSISTIEELPGHLAGGKTLAGLDLGDKTIGVAVSDRGLSFAHPRPVIIRKKFSADAAALLDLLGRENAGDGAERPSRHDEAGDAADDRQQHGLRQQLPDQLPA